jgi:hypothetical protein
MTRKFKALSRQDRGYTFPLNRTPLPADAASADRWHRKSEGYTREFQSKAFRVFRGLTVRTGGVQVLMDGEPRPFTVRAITLSISGELVGAPLWEYQAREFAQALIDAADYISEHSAGDGDVRAARWIAIEPEVDEDDGLADLRTRRPVEDADAGWQIIQRVLDGSA